MSASFKRDLLALINKIETEGLEGSLEPDSYNEVSKIVEEYQDGLIGYGELALELVAINLKVRGSTKEEIEQATRYILGVDGSTEERDDDSDPKGDNVKWRKLQQNHAKQS